MLTIHRAIEAGQLADELAALIAEPLADPFAPEVIVVPAKGVERWLSQRIAARVGTRAGHGDGIAANLDYSSPARLVARCVQAGSEPAGAPGGAGAEPAGAPGGAGAEPLGETGAGPAGVVDPWSGPGFVWAVLAAIDDAVSEPWARVLAHHLGAGQGQEHRAGRRYSTAGEIAELFARYDDERPAMIQAWARGEDADGTGAPVPADSSWQPRLWREIRARIDAPSPAERLPSLCARVEADPGLVDLPERMHVFGVTGLSATALHVLGALAAGRALHMWLPHPSPVVWDRLANSPLPGGNAPRLRVLDRDDALVRHPLTKNLGRDVREFQRVLSALEPVALDPAAPVPAMLNSAAMDPALPNTVLGALQREIAGDRPGELHRPRDLSVRFHACHGPARQVAVLREVLLGLFAADPTLQPREVVVMCPDVEVFAPLISAAFGQHDAAHPGQRLPVRMADRGLLQTNPLFKTVTTLLDLVGGRVIASDVLDLAATVPVRRRFGFSDDELERMREWTQQSGARWGLNRTLRAPFGLAQFPQNTFETSLDRLLVGVAADESEPAWLDRTLPLDDVPSTDIDLMGRYSEFVDQLTMACHQLRGPHPAARWLELLTEALDELTDTARADAWQRVQVRRELAAAFGAGAQASLRLADVRSMIARRLGGKASRENFRTGEITVATLVPMRSVPHRVVVLLGLDDEVFPRAGLSRGDDLLARGPLVGERDPRSRDRQLLLDALMSAQEQFLVFFTGTDPVSGAERPAPAPVQELLDAVAQVIGDTTDDLITRHPLQGFDERNFLPGGVDVLDADQSLSFDSSALAGARVRGAVQPRREVPAHTLRLSPLDEDQVRLADLIAFVENPAKALLRQRFGLRVADQQDVLQDQLDAELNGLSQWAVGDRLLRGVLAGASVDDVVAAERRRGTLPPFELGTAALARVIDDVRQLYRPVGSLWREPQAREVDAGLADGRRLVGSVSGVCGAQILSVQYSKMKPKTRLAAWVQLLALAATEPGPWTSLTVAREWKSPRRSQLRLPDDPVAVLNDLVALRDVGLTRLLPIAPQASETFARICHGSDPDRAWSEARNAWSSGYDRDSGDPSMSYLMQDMSFEDFTRLPVGPDGERLLARHPGSSPFAQLAALLWRPLLAVEDEGRA